MMSLIRRTASSFFAFVCLDVVSKNLNMPQLSGFPFRLLKPKILKTPWRTVTARDQIVVFFSPQFLAVYEDSRNIFTLHTMYNERHKSWHFLLSISPLYSQVYIGVAPSGRQKIPEVIDTRPFVPLSVKLLTWCSQTQTFFRGHTHTHTHTHTHLLLLLKTLFINSIHHIHATHCLSSMPLVFRYFPKIAKTDY